MAGILLVVVKLLLRFALIAGILAYFLAAAGLLTTRYWLLPRIDQWRPQIQAALSEAVGTPVRFDAITADWRGLNANLQITNLTILDDQGVAQLGVPKTDAIVSWRSLFAMQPVFRYIGVDDVILVARRSPEGQLYVAGFEVDTDDQTQPNFWQSDTMRWLLKQGRVNIQNSRLVWVDQARQAVPLVIEDIDITADNHLIGHKLALKATLPAQWGGKVELVADVDSVHGSFSRLLLDEPDGYVFVSVTELFADALHPWIDLPEVEGSFATRLWVDLLDGKFTNFSVALAGRDTAYKPTEFDEQWFTLGQFRWQATGPLALLGADVQFPGLIQTPRSPQRLNSSLTLENGFFQAPASGMQPIQADQLSAEFSLSRPTSTGFRVDIKDLAFANPDGLITARGAWALDGQGKGGQLDIQGTLARFKLPNLHHYLPDTIGEDAHKWLATAFTAGMVPRASFEISGLVDDFPFGASDGPGTFRIDGTVQDWAVDYSPVSQPGELPWPPLADMNGTLTMLNDRIAVGIATGALSLPKGERINLSELSAELVDLEGDPMLTIKGQTNAQADDYLALFKDTALRDIAPDFVRDFTGKGDWQMPLALRVPLNDVDQTSFNGELGFNGGSVTYAGAPPLSKLSGVALLSDKGFESQGLAGELLGGKVEVAGGMNGTLDTISGKGELDWAELAKFTGSQVVGDWLKGKMTYDLSASVKDEKFDISVASDLRGTQIALPAPLGLSAGQSASTRLNLQGELTGNKPHTWGLTVADRLALSATSVRGDQTPNSSFFITAHFALGSAKPITGNGLTLAAEFAAVTLDDWMPVVDVITRDAGASSGRTPSPFPPLVQAKLQTKQFVMQGNRLEDVTVDLSVRNARQYTANITAAQTKGSVQWALDQGKLQDGFQVRLDRLEIGRHGLDKDTGNKPVAKQSADAPVARQAPALPDPKALSNLPALDIEIKDLTLYGARLGEFKLAGRNSANQQQWQISNLQITNPHAELTATGSCRFTSNPGVTLDAELKIADLGELTKFLGQGDLVRKGRGTLKANIDWAQFPWRFDYAGLSGKAELSLEEGVFDHVNSSSARVLELLSMQSLNRILDANINPEESFSQGFPWSSINGAFDIKSGLVDTQDLVVNSPVATISLTGSSSLVSKTWDLEAVVRPNLDMSGTALATGFLVNPIVGLSALVGQYLLRNPVESALSQRYQVSGPWEDPKIVEGARQKNQAEPVNRQPDVRN